MNKITRIVFMYLSCALALNFGYRGIPVITSTVRLLTQKVRKEEVKYKPQVKSFKLNEKAILLRRVEQKLASTKTFNDNALNTLLSLKDYEDKNAKAYLSSKCRDP